MTGAAAPPAEFAHPALFYGNDEEYLAGLVPFVTDGLALAQPVAAAVPHARLAALADALGADAAQVTLIDMNEAGRNPGRILAAVLHRFADTYPDRHVRIIAEAIWVGRSEIEYPACVQHEALVNPSFLGRDGTIVCPYDLTHLAPAILADARTTHPLLWEAAARYPSDHYAPDDIIDRYNQPFPAGIDAAEILVASPADVPIARHTATAHALRLGLAEDRLPDFELIVTELITNSIEHAKSPCRLSIWRHVDYLACEVRDAGHITDPLAGRRPATAGQFRGRGLLLVHQLADLVRTHTGPTGTSQYALLRLGGLDQF